MALVKRKATQPAEPGALKQQRSCEELAAALEDADAAARRHAARDIVPCPYAASKLVCCLNREQDAAVREAILNSLVRLNDPSAISGLVDCLRSEDAALRNEVIETFKHMNDEVVPVLRSLLADPDPDVRIFVVNILDSERHQEAESWLIEVIERDKHVNVCATAVDLLCEVATEAAIDPLVRLKDRFRSEAYIQFAADLAIKRIREV
jgi:HEAT repeat protein